ncbi:hypothetical protein EYF88_08680 [Paracoccus sediminis]|uniref:ATP synthase F0 subunit B n=1 Tax=Paracoccus sediminis TaxID=1214787 RepID=A0A238WB76_9RHOB|nr:hypothetical protein [Paracoccus sediminis]TBN50970.1 hypothetical protein EYF88_08680 [Paracoccus sediminis]SNR43812.1 hypothetical protein SAMN06265378_10445 [Paracoccus sediminis]
MNVSPDAQPPRSIMDWPAILSGAAVAAAAMVVFTGFTAAIGLGSVSAEPGEGLGTFAMILVGFFAFLSTLGSYALGGYIAGRMRTPVQGIGADETKARDGAHGLTVWAIGTLVGALLTLGLVSGGVRAVGSAAGTVVEAGGSAVGGALQGAGQLAGGVVSGAGQVAGGAISGVGQAAGGVVQGAGEAAGGDTMQDMLPDGLVQNPLDYISNRLLRADDTAPANYSDEAIRDEIASIVGSVMRTGELAQEDRDYLVRAVAARTQLTQPEVEARVDQAVTEVQTLRDEAEQRLADVRAQAEEAVTNARTEAERLQQEAEQQLEQARQAAVDAAETARRAAVWSAFFLAASTLIAGAVAFLAAIRGGRDRDEGRVWAGLHRGIRDR